MSVSEQLYEQEMSAAAGSHQKKKEQHPFSWRSKRFQVKISQLNKKVLVTSLALLSLSSSSIKSMRECKDRKKRAVLITQWVSRYFSHRDKTHVQRFIFSAHKHFLTALPIAPPALLSPPTPLKNKTPCGHRPSTIL